MLKAELVERIPGPDGGMARKFAITAEGTLRLEAERSIHARALQSVMADWTP